MIRDRIIESVAKLKRYGTADTWTPETIAAQILMDIPEISALDGLQCRECGANLTELDLVISDGVCQLCRDVSKAVPV